MLGAENAIEVRGVKKTFKVYYDKGMTVKDKILSRNRSKYEKREVLRGITFSVKKGEAVGLIGKNGCGKSTTLKLLSKIIYPNEGSVEVVGRVSSLLELGAGFHPDMSGLENIYMNAAVFGLNKKDIDKRVSSIIKFSELEEFIDNPVRTYSSGMYMRLAFSVAINVDADVLLVDEILAVGDVSFQKKCFDKLKDIKRSGTTIVIVSHSLDQIEKICDRTIWIENGLIKEEGKPLEIHEHYLYAMEKERLGRFQEEYYEGLESSVQTNEDQIEKQVEEQIQKPFEETVLQSDVKEETETGEVSEKMDGIDALLEITEKMNALQNNFLSRTIKKSNRKGNQNVCFTEMYITDEAGEEKVYFETGESIVVYLKYKAKMIDARGTICLLVYCDDGTYVYGTNTFIEHKEVLALKEEGTIKVVMQQVPLLPGKYFFALEIHDEQAIPLDKIDEAAMFQMFSNKGEQGICRMRTEWSINIAN